MTQMEEGYSSRYQKIKTNKLRSLSPVHYEKHGDSSPLREVQKSDGNQQLGKVVADMSERIDGIEIKIVSITNIVKLLQKYTETKDMQYEKQKQNEEFIRNYSDRGIQSIPSQSRQMQYKLNELQSTIQRAKAQITAMQSLRVSMEREKAHSVVMSPSPTQTGTLVQSPQSLPFSSISEQLQRHQESLREQLNRKLQIALNHFQNCIQNVTRNAPMISSTGSVNNTMLQEQVHNLMLMRNRVITDNKIQQIVTFVHSLSKNNSTPKEHSRSFSRSEKKVTKNDPEDSQSQRSSISKSRKSKSKSQGKKPVTDRKGDDGKVVSLTRIQEQKKIKEAQLKEVLRKKKENQEKLRIKK